MDATELRASLRVLLAVAQADGEVDEAERDLLLAAAGKLSVSTSSSQPLEVDVDAELAKLKSEDVRRLTYRAAHSMANVDGHCSPAELALLVRIHDAFGIGGKPDIEVAETAAAAQMRRVRSELQQVSDEFLHEVASKGGSLTEHAYELLVHALEEKKVALLRASLRG